MFGRVKSGKFQKMYQKISEKRSRIIAWAFSYLVHWVFQNLTLR